MAALPLVFALVLAAAVLATSVLIFVMGARFQKVEQAAYLGDRKPWWFIVGLVAFAGLYVVALAGFIATPEKTWAGWVLMVVIPAGAALKAVLVPVFLVLAYFV